MFCDLHQVQWEPVSATKTCLMFFGFLVQAMGTCLLKKTLGLNYRPLKAGHGHDKACNGQTRRFERFLNISATTTDDTYAKWSRQLSFITVL